MADSYTGQKAVGGGYLPSTSGIKEHESLAFTKKELSPWIRVDLATNYLLEGVKIWDRSEATNPGE